MIVRKNASLAERWLLTESVRLRDELLNVYAEPRRSYHNTRHLAEVLDRLDELDEHGISFDQLTVSLAAWFHDAVYAGLPDDEEQSARWAEQALKELAPERITSEVARLVRLTKTHHPADDDANGGALCDADLAILASSTQRYAEYTHAVRAEYRHVSDQDYRTGRAAVLRSLAAKPHLFHTHYARDKWEPTAKVNIYEEIAILKRSRSA